MVVSYTTAAAAEVKDRGIGVARHMVGTLHAVCYRALEEPELAELHVKEFNEEHRHHAITASKADVDEASDGPAGTTSADALFASYQVLRARMTPRQVWPRATLGFALAWEAWKTDRGFLDFNDLIERACAELTVAPGYPKVLFVDEAQDLSALQFACIRKWGARTERLVLIGDDDQAIFDFSGADAANLIGRDLPEDHKRVLSQSYRLPKQVLDFSQRLIRTVSARQEKAFAPRREADGRVAEGLVRFLPYGHHRAPQAILDDAQRQADAGRSVMLLASCSYMLDAMVKEMKARGMRFHNPYRVANGAWNPVRAGEGSTTARLATFLKGGLSPEWTLKDLRSWTGALAATGVLKRGAKKRLDEDAKHEDGEGVRVLEIREMMELLEDGPWLSLDPWAGRAVELAAWYAAHATSQRQASALYAAEVVKRQGAAALGVRPLIVVGTIHSVKGGEADIVYLFPDLSREGWASWRRGGAYGDAVVRTMYVGASRAREELVLLPPATGTAIELRRFLES